MYFDGGLLASAHDVQDNVNVEVCGFDELGDLFSLSHDHFEWLGSSLQPIYMCFLCDSSMHTQQQIRSSRQLGSIHTMLLTSP